MNEVKISELDYVDYQNFTSNDLFVIVNYNDPSGETKNTTVNDIRSYVLSGTPIGSDTYITGFTYNNNTFLLSDNSGTTFNATIDSVTGLTVTGGLSTTTLTVNGVNVGGLNNVVYVNSLLDLPPVIGGTRTLLPNTTYSFNSGTMLLGSDYLTLSDGTVIEGQSSFNTALVYSGVGGAIRGVNCNFAIRQITVSASKVFELTNLSLDKNVSVQNVGLLNQTTQSSFIGFNLVFFSQVRVLSSIGGMSLSGVTSFGMDYVVFDGTNSGTYVTLTPTLNSSVEITHCDFDIDGSSVGLFITSPNINTGLITACNFKGNAPIANRLVGINGNTPNWVITYGTNNGISGLQFVDIEISTTTNASLGNSVGTYVDTGIKSYALPLSSYDPLATVMEAKITALMTNTPAVQVGVYDITNNVIVGGLGTAISGTDVAVASNFISITPNREYSGYYVKPTGSAVRKSIKLTLKIY
jgi:hypothetical protein